MKIRHILSIAFISLLLGACAAERAFLVDEQSTENMVVTLAELPIDKHTQNDRQSICFTKKATGETVFCSTSDSSTLRKELVKTALPSAATLGAGYFIGKGLSDQDGDNITAQGGRADAGSSSLVTSPVP